MFTSFWQILECWKCYIIAARPRASAYISGNARVPMLQLLNIMLTRVINVCPWTGVTMISHS